MTNPKRLLFCGTPEFAVPSLQFLATDPHFKVVKVISQPDRPSGRGHKMQASPVKQKALQLGLDVETPENINSTSVLDSLRALNLDAIVVVAYGQILKQDFLDLCPQRCVNLHGSCLPHWRGAAPLQRALMAGDTEGGVSLQVIVRKLDAGPVIGERVLPISRDRRADEWHNLLQEKGVELFREEFVQFLNGQISAKMQDESLVTYAEKIQKSEAQIDWQKTAEQIHNQVRGLALGPHATTSYNTQNLKIHRTQWREDDSVGDGFPGVVVDVQKTFFSVRCGEGVLDIFELQPESKKRMSSEDFLKGFSLTVGGLFGT